jgi:predicted transporter
MRLHPIDLAFWWATPIIMSWVAFAMYRRGLHREFPYFFNYVVLQVLSFAVEFPLRGSTNFFWISWFTTALSVAFSFGVLLEIFKDAFRPYEALRDLSVILFRWCALVVLLVAGMWAMTSWQASDPDNIKNAIYLISRCVRMMQCALVFFMLLFSEYLGISRRNVVFGISIGFGFFAGVNMLVITALSHNSVITHLALRRLNSAAYVVSMLIWLGYSLLPSTVRSGVKQTQKASQKWDYALDEVRNAAPPVSLLDSMDKTVERLLYHRGSEAGVTVTNRH